MTITPGSRLGPYEILAPLGAGGMGEVYRARDPRLGREVAVKVLPASLSSDGDRLRRFEQEARAAGVLNHPNVIAVFDVGSVEGSPYVVCELLEGETLRDRLGGGALAPRRAIDYAIQIANGLAAAHEKGIVHRDLKPENVFVTRDGRVKILDFGLAKLTQAGAGGAPADLPTASGGTEPGVVMGTVGYMSPEQVRGRPADARSDIFSLGAILYEMLSGRRAFVRETAAETMSAILRDDPPSLESADRQIAPAFDRVVHHCLEKDPEARFHSAHDLAFDLAALATAGPSGAQAPPAHAVVAPRRVSLPGLAVAVAVALVAGGALGVLVARRPHGERGGRPARFAVAIPPGTTYAPNEVSRGVSISPDGTRLVVEAFAGGRRHLFLRRLDSERFTELEGTAGAGGHFWSPDGRFIAFHADGMLKKVPAEGGPAEELCPADFQTVGTWNREGTILFAALAAPGIYRVSDRGGEPVRLLAADPSKKEVALIWPHFLPDGRRFLYLASRGETEPRELRLTSLDSHESRFVADLNSRFELAPPGYLLFAREGALFAQPFDQKEARFTGEPRLVADSVHYFYGPSHAAFSVSEAGVIAYQAAQPPSRLVWLDRAGKAIGTLGQPSVTRGFRISADGARVAAALENPRTGTADVWVFELERGVSTRLHSDAVDEKSPVWSPDGARVFYRSDHRGPPDIYQIAVGAPGTERLLVREPGVQQPEDVTRDGRLLAYLCDTQARPDIRLLSLAGEPSSAEWLRIPFNVSSPRFSPDGRWIAYTSDESGAPEVYVARTEGAEGKRRLSPAGGRQPRWRGDGKELYYVAADDSMLAVAVASGAGLEIGPPVALFRVGTGVEDFDVAPDGARFLVCTRLEDTPESPIRVILDWPAVVER